jgi:hypothetical protein
VHIHISFLGKEMKQRMTNAEKAIYYRELKKNKNRQKKLKYYHSISNIINEKRSKHREPKQTKFAVLKRNQRQKQIERKERQRGYQKEYRQRLKQRATDEKSENASLDLNAFRNRTSRARAINRLKSSLPRTPNKRTVVLHKYLSSDSPVASKVKKRRSYN